MADGRLAVRVIRLNPSHGKRPAEYDVWRMIQGDVAFQHENSPGLESPAA
jgi:hypothetical protein